MAVVVVPKIFSGTYGWSARYPYFPLCSSGDPGSSFTFTHFVSGIACRATLASATMSPGGGFILWGFVFSLCAPICFSFSRSHLNLPLHLIPCEQDFLLGVPRLVRASRGTFESRSTLHSLKPSPKFPRPFMVPGIGWRPHVGAGGGHFAQAALLSRRPSTTRKKQGETTFGSHPCLRYPPPFSFWCCCRRGGGRATLCAPTFPLATRNHLAAPHCLSYPFPCCTLLASSSLLGLWFEVGGGPRRQTSPPHPIGAFGDLLPLQVQAMDSAETNSGFLSQFFYPHRCYPNAPLPSCTLGTEHPYISTGTWQSSTQRFSCTISA